MTKSFRAFAVVFPVCVVFIAAAQQPLPRSEWGAPDVIVSHAEGKWLIAGKRNRVTFDATNFAMTVQTGSTLWAMMPSGPNDMLVKSDGSEFPVRLADAKHIAIKPAVNQ